MIRRFRRTAERAATQVVADRELCNQLLAPLANRTLGKFQVGWAVALSFDEAPWYDVIIEGDARFEQRDDLWTGDATELAGVERLHALLREDLVSASVGEDGSLRLEFGEAVITALVDDNYESWQVVADDGLHVVSMPGGGLAVWTPKPS